MTDTTAETPAPAGEVLDDAAEDNLFAEFASAKAPEIEDPETPVEETPTPEGDEKGEEKPAPADDPKPDATATPAAAPAAAAKDIWADAPAELRAAHEEALNKADQKYRSDIGRQAAHQRLIKSLEDENKALREAAKPAATAEPADTKPVPLRERPDIKKMLEDYPEVAEPMVQQMEALQQQMESHSRDISSWTESRREEFYASQERALETAHPDWKAQTNRPEFVEWLNTRPQAVKDMIVKNGKNIVNADDAISVIADFKLHHPPKPQPTPQADPKVEPTPDPAPTKLADRRAAQLRSVTGSPSSKPGAIPTAAGATTDDALFNHFADRKAAKR